MAIVIWTAALAVKKQAHFKSLSRGLLPFLLVWTAILLPIAPSRISPRPVWSAFWPESWCSRPAGGSGTSSSWVLPSLPMILSKLDEWLPVESLRAFWNPGLRSQRRGLPGPPVAGGHRVGGGHRGRVRRGPPEVRVPSGAPQRLHLRHDRGGMGTPWRPFRRKPFHDADHGRVSHRTAGARISSANSWPSGSPASSLSRPLSTWVSGLGLVPNTGLALPLISYGRSNLVVTMASIGILMSIARAQPDREGGAWLIRRAGPTWRSFPGGGTGGHLYPALALADALSKLRPDLRTFFVGARQGVEARILPERGEDHLLLPVRGFRRGRVLENLGVGLGSASIPLSLPGSSSPACGRGSWW